MKSVQDYISIYRGIANNLEITGDSVEVLVQLLSQWSYLNEMELVNYVNESSLETAALENSKIQHCVDRMYSVFRGSCPRVKLRFIPHKYLRLKDYDLVYSSGNINLYYHGDPIVISPATKSEEYTTITCILAKTIKTYNRTFVNSNRYYVDITETNLSNDGYVKINGDIIPIYRKFSDHIRYGGLFDLTIPDYGMRIYAPDIFRSVNESESSDEELVESGTTVEANMFEYCILDDFSSGLDKIKIDGTEMPLKSDILDSEDYPGITLIKETPRDELISLHYKANRDRYSNSIIRSNSDIGVLLEEEFPDKVVKGGTTYEFNKSDESETTLDIYYIPYNTDNLITEEDIENFRNNNKSYYVTEDINIIKGTECTVRFDIDVELYKNYRIDDEVDEILSRYEDKFNIDLDSKIPEIEALISKISNVRSVIKTRTPEGTLTPGIKVWEINEDGDKIEYVHERTKYCKIEFNLTSTIYRREGL